MEKRSNHNILIVVLVVLTLSAIALSGYFSFQLVKEKDALQAKNRENAELMSKLRDPKLTRTIESTKVFSVNTGAKQITLGEEKGQKMTLDVVNSSKIQKVVLAMDGKTKSWKDTTISEIGENTEVRVTFNGLNEVVSLSFMGK